MTSLTDGKAVGQPAPNLGSLTSLVLSYEELAKVLHVSRRALQELVSKRAIPHRRVGLQVRFYWPAIEEWLGGSKKRS